MRKINSCAISDCITSCSKLYTESENYNGPSAFVHSIIAVFVCTSLRVLTMQLRGLLTFQRVVKKLEIQTKVGTPLYNVTSNNILISQRGHLKNLRILFFFFFLQAVCDTQIFHCLDSSSRILSLYLSLSLFPSISI